MRLRKCLIMATLAFSPLAFSPANAKADPLTLTINNPNQSGVVGNILTFAATLTNAAVPAVQVVSSQITFNDGGGTLFLDEGPFVSNFLFQNTGPGATLGPLDAFTVEILAAATPGTYSGVLSVLYDNGTSVMETNLFQFSVTVVPSTAPIPEPATVLLLGSSLSSLIAYKRARKKRCLGNCVRST